MSMNMWLNGSSLRNSSSTRTTTSTLPQIRTPRPCIVSAEAEECLYAVFESMMNSEKLCDLSNLLVKIRSSISLDIIANNRNEIISSLDVLTPKMHGINYVSWKAFLELIDKHTKLVREKKAVVKSYHDHLMAKFTEVMSSTRNVYAQTLRRAGIDVSDEVVEEVQPKLYSQRFREAQVLLEKAYAESAINITPREEVSARSPIQMPAIVFDEPVPMEIEDVDETQDLTEIFIAARLRPLESHELQSIEALIRGHSNDEVLIDKFNIPFKRKDCVTLRDGQWLNDECINFYMQMLKQRDEELCKLNAKRVPSHFFNSFFIKRLLDDEGGKYSYGNVKRWTKKFDVFASNKLFFPVNISNTHWTLAVVFMRLKRICYFDSMAGKGTRYLQGLQRWASDEHKDKKGTELDDAAFELVPCNRNTTPQQMNGVDCGVFTTMFADFLSDDLDLMEFQQVNIPMFRRKIGHFILQGTLDYPLQ